MEPNYGKLAFGHSINPEPCNDCHAYGSLNGCDEGCPQLLRGDCPEEAVVLETLELTKEDLEL